MATTLRNDAKHEIINILRKQGYPTYARIVDLFDIYLTDDPDVIGYMIPGSAKIVLNQELSIDQVSTIVRHEVLHEFLTHGPRQEKFAKEHPELNANSAPHDISNIAADYEISNQGYTDADKRNIRNIKLGDKVLKGLVTEDEHPDWVDLSYEEMYKKLLEQIQQDRESMKDILDQIDKLSKQDLSDMLQDAQNCDSDSSSDEQPQDSSKGSSQTKSQQTSPDTSDKVDSGSSSSKTEDDAESQSNIADKIEDAVKDLIDDYVSAEASSDSDSRVFDTPEQQAAKADVAARAKQIREILDDLKSHSDLESENRVAKQKEKAAKAARDVDRYQGTGLHQFKLNLNRFISDQVGEMEDDSYSRIHPSYEDSEFILPGKIVREEKNIPLINVYHDVSGSFNTEEKTAAAFKAIESLNQYVRDGDIEIKVYYFADRVSDRRSNAGGGTRGTPILDHVEQTKPTNVIVITDGDITDCRRTVTVPGAVWMLFYDSRSENLMNSLKGKRQNKYYDIEY